MRGNEVYVTTNLDDEKLCKDDLKLTDVHWINGEPDLKKTYQVRTRYRAPLVDGTLRSSVSDSKHAIYSAPTLHIALSEPVRAVTPGQSAVIYEGDRVVGGGIIV